MENVTKERVYNLQMAIMEANRCLLCDDAPCNTDCGADTQPAKFIRQLKMGNIKGAIRTIRQNNALGGVCAHICPTCRLCVKGCSRSGLDEPIHISEIQAFLMDYERKEGLKVLNAPEPGDKRVAVIGSGPAGLSAAANLAIKGYSVTVFDRSLQPGGILRHAYRPTVCRMKSSHTNWTSCVTLVVNSNAVCQSMGRMPLEYLVFLNFSHAPFSLTRLLLDCSR
jgi:NADPH-dependent glutamate synthase beta subunit-like oxidoreductase